MTGETGALQSKESPRNPENNKPVNRTKEGFRS